MSKAGNDLVLYSAVGLLISKKEAPLRSPQDNLDVLRHDLAWNICPEGRAGVGWLRNRSRYRKLHKGRDTSAHEETTAHDIDHFRVPPHIVEADMRRPCKRKDLSAMAVVPAWRIVYWVEDREGKRRSNSKGKRPKRRWKKQRNRKYFLHTKTPAGVFQRVSLYRYEGRLKCYLLPLPEVSGAHKWHTIPPMSNAPTHIQREA